MHRVKLIMSWSLCCWVRGWPAGAAPSRPDRLATGAPPDPGWLAPDEHPPTRTPIATSDAVTIRARFAGLRSWPRC